MTNAIRGQVHTPDEVRGDVDLRATFGVKAAELCEFGWRCRELGHPVPASWLLPVAALDPVLADGPLAAVRWPDGFAFPPLPGPEEPPRSAGAARWCAERLAPVLADLPTGPGLLRTSVVWPDPGRRPPGMDVTVSADGPLRALGLYQGVHKAYSDLCRRRWHGGEPRFGVILTERVPVLLEGTAYVGPFGLAVEVGPGGAKAPVLGTTPSRIAASGLLSRSESVQLFDRLAELAGAVPVGQVAELEFLFDRDRRLVPTQRRMLPLLSQGPQPFHTPGTVHGEAVDLRSLPRDPQRLADTLDTAAGSIWVVAVADDVRTDLFALLWTLDRSPELPRPAALVLTRGDESQAGMPTHLRWLAALSLAGTQIRYLPDSAVARGDGPARTWADGVRADYRKERR
ncbi:hypothetical protein [Micromonospora sp. NBRC 101691]|uniref:hypothetical protein n=1 Tax=Micromonospora sp. NBRC 101691 TaxID=3032198 RepID=UPI0024A149E6|nr:hypothetical protein [Micromonospora sp. NBRC 101691]GLY26211.1 hypothetical protein Misp04_59420 [Micromonospora sp. NBRC 101691]